MVSNRTIEAYMILEKRQMLGGFAVFLLALSLHISANHYQMTYYLALGMLLFMVVYAIASFKNGEFNGSLNIVSI